MGPVHLKNLFPQPFYTTCGVSRAPFYKTCGEAATTTLGAKGPVKLNNLKNLRGAAPSTLTPKVCPYKLENN